jgi:prolyl-tRNA synthetase
MGKNKQFVEEITSMEDDFARWYTDVVTKAELVDYGAVRGSMIIRPYGYAIWENIQKVLDGKIKETGHENVYMPLFIPESLLQKEKDHIEGLPKEFVCVQLQKFYFASIIKILFILTGIYQNFIINGRMLCDGKKQQDHSCVL